MNLSRVGCNVLFQMSSRGFATKFATPKLVKQLRLLTGSPLKDCMAALEESQGDIEGSKEYLRKKGLAMADKKADRSATQGLIGIL